MANTLENIAMNQCESLVHKARKGDQQSFGKLVGLWFKRVYNFCLRYFGDHDLAMEATQQTFIATHQNIRKLKEAKRFKSWLYVIALNQCREEDRKQKRKSWRSIFQHEEVMDIEDSFNHPEEAYREMEQEEILSDMLGRLPEEQRIIVIMKEYEGLKFREIAIALDISENTAKSRLYYGLKALRKMIEQSELDY
jgi:RNA polymerase sigma-70 factor (ECF subfamily)